MKDEHELLSYQVHHATYVGIAFCSCGHVMHVTGESQDEIAEKIKAALRRHHGRVVAAN
jgi:hypothetical protein